MEMEGCDREASSGWMMLAEGGVDSGLASVVEWRKRDRRGEGREYHER